MSVTFVHFLLVLLMFFSSCWGWGIGRGLHPTINRSIFTCCYVDVDTLDASEQNSFTLTPEWLLTHCSWEAVFHKRMLGFIHHRLTCLRNLDELGSNSKFEMRVVADIKQIDVRRFRTLLLNLRSPMECLVVKYGSLIHYLCYINSSNDSIT